MKHLNLAPATGLKSRGHKNSRLWLFGMFAVLGLGACQQGSKKTDSVPTNKSANDTVRIASAAGPVAWLGCQLVGQPCAWRALVPAGASAHSWEPRPSDMQKLQETDWLIRTGLSFENSWTPRFQAAAPSMVVLDVRGGLTLQDQHEGHEAEHEGHEAGHGHAAEPADPHVWSSPKAMRVLADTLEAVLLRTRPKMAARVQANREGLHQKLARLDSLANALLGPKRGTVFLVNHPGFGYLAHDYGLVQKSLEMNGQEISPVVLVGLQKSAAQHQWKAIFLQPEHSRRTADALAQTLRLPVLPVDLLAGEWDTTMVRGLQTIAENL